MSVDAERSPVLHMKVLQRAHELPLIKSAATYVTTFYQQAKDYSPLVNKTLNIAESGAKLAGLVATPVITRFDGSFHKVDNVACQALDTIKERYPCIGMETEEVSACIHSAKAGICGGAGKYAGVLLESTPGQFALVGLAGYLTVANKVADIALPEEESGCCVHSQPVSSPQVDSYIHTIGNGESTISFESSNLALLNVATLSDKLYRRIYKHSTVQLQQLQEVTTKALIGLQSHITALELAAKGNLDKYGINNQTERLWEQLQSTTCSMRKHTLMVPAQISQKFQDGTAAATENALLLAKLISSQLDALYAEVASSASNLSAAVRNALMKSKSHADRLYLQLSQVKSTEDITTLVLSQIKDTLNLLQSYLYYVFKAAA